MSNVLKDSWDEEGSSEAKAPETVAMPSLDAAILAEKARMVEDSPTTARRATDVEVFVKAAEQAASDMSDAMRRKRQALNAIGNMVKPGKRSMQFEALGRTWEISSSIRTAAQFLRSEMENVLGELGPEDRSIVSGVMAAGVKVTFSEQQWDALSVGAKSLLRRKAQVKQRSTDWVLKEVRA